MYTLTMMQAGGYGWVVILALILAVVVWFVTIGGHEFYRGQDVSGHYRAFYIGQSTIVALYIGTKNDHNILT